MEDRGEKCLTIGDLKSLSDRMVRVLRPHGIGPGDAEAKVLETDGRALATVAGTGATANRFSWSLTSAARSEASVAA